jgi:tRNA U34 5-carboxymethylaminomethyl modifying enzyme MnmG/GidA
MGLKTALYTLNVDLIAQMSCNPAVGGIAKGHLVREVDALGGIMGEITDAVGIQFRLLNTSRGPAVWSPRAQCDKQAYRLKMREVLEAQPNLKIKQAEVADLIIEDRPGSIQHSALSIQPDGPLAPSRSSLAENLQTGVPHPSRFSKGGDFADDQRPFLACPERSEGTNDPLPSAIRNELKSVETEIKYEGYLLQQQRAIERLKKSEQRNIPEWFDYKSVSGLSREMQETLVKIRPRTLGHASRIPGVTPAAVSLVNVFIEIQAKRRQLAAVI